MGKTIEELFKTKVLNDGLTAQKRYEIRDSKSPAITPGNSLLDLSFKGASAIRKSSSSKGNTIKETFIESEIRGLRMINTLSSPIIYGTDIFRFKKKSTKMVDVMKDSVNPGQDSGIIGNLFNKVENFGLKTLGKIGVVFPDHLIPTKVSLNQKFKSGKEPDTMVTLAEIKKDGKGSISGQILKNVKGNPKQILNGVVGTSVDLLKKEVRKVLFGAPKQGAQNLAKKNEYETQYDSFARYSSTIDQYNGDVILRNDLSSLQEEKRRYKKKTEREAISKLMESSPKYQPKGLPLNTPNLGGKLNLDTSRFNIGGKVSSISDSIKGGLSGARKEGQSFLSTGKKIGDIKPYYDNTDVAPDPIIKYSETVDEQAEDIKLRNDLSSKLDKLIEVKEESKNTKKESTSALPGSPVNVKPEAKTALTPTNKKKAENKIKNEVKLGRKEEQQNIEKKDETAVDLNQISKYNDGFTYSGTIDATQEDVLKRNDKSAYLEALMEVRKEMESGERKGLAPLSRDFKKNAYSKFKSKEKDSARLEQKYGIDGSKKLDFLNEKTSYKLDKTNSENGILKLKDGTLLDEYDFITLKFKSKASGETVNFRATVTGISETLSPSWESAKFIGNPFSYYTYSGIERSVSFKFKVYSTTPLQHVAAWERLNFLTSLVYPQGYKEAYAIPPFVVFTLGNLYKNKNCFIESLSYDVDDVGGWEIGSIGVGSNGAVGLNGETYQLKDYKLPIIVDVNITLKFVESPGTATRSAGFYGFGKTQPEKGQDGKPLQSNNIQKLSDSNNENSFSSNDALSEENQVPEKLTKSEQSTENKVQSTTPTQGSVVTTAQSNKEVESAISVPKPPNYKIIANAKGDGFTGNVYADGKLILSQNYVSTFGAGIDNKNYEGLEAVSEDLKWQAKHRGFYNDGVFYEKSDNIS